MSEQIETEIGAVIEYKGKKVMCVEDLSEVCMGCLFDRELEVCKREICDSCLRSDRETVMFIEVEE